jgi:membrane-associated phospholipid phosphatase
MPSLHAAYPALLLLFFWRDGWRLRIPLALYTLAMGFTLVYGGEHFLIDILVGWAYAAVAFSIVRLAGPAWRLARAPSRRAAEAAEPPSGETQPTGARVGAAV